ncbi:putative GDP dissociation inhibitor, FAD/NAD(P)-binding domain-containing protein [Rosa chinensis]|uniref:Rab escort protein 1 n=1 Tax=Rosa chinensis TaxID=74649 RepID=A0A2P6RLB9_ROSCH|nr:rab escort protein 1 [Rosa chinensis]XP_040370081.1 rab escort protein 1 [Rosa chinensis]PRQ47218.1 putative GDP dissociation inhibitor, FAD/NAD(P)-binding domain-containing protein [Rosa chinensis]
MSESPFDDPIEPTSFDLIVIGTGLPESVIAAAASTSGKTVLQLDPNDSYGSHFASHTLDDLTSFVNSHATPPPSTAGVTSSEGDYTTLDLNPRSLYSHIETANYAPEILAEHSRRFLIDIGGPRVLFCADKAIELILKLGVGSYLNFKAVDGNLIWDESSGGLCNVPDSRAAIFKDKGMSLKEKNQLMRFFKLVQQHLAAAASDGEQDNESSKISEEDLETPFVDFLTTRLPHKIKSIILYSIAMVDYDQDNPKVYKSILKTRDGISRLALYQKSVGRFPDANGAFLYPMYGHGELSQAFCRRAAVKGCLQVLRRPVISLLMDKDSGQYKGVRLVSGQDLLSHRLVMDPTFTVPLPPASSPPDLPKESLKGDKRMVARGICITTRSLKPDISNLLLVYPPRSLFSEQDTSVRAIQIRGGTDGGGLAVCPSSMFVLYFSALCDDAEQGKRLLHAAMNALLTLPVSGNLESGSTVQSEDAELKATLLWSMLYIQEITTGQYEHLISTPMPDGNLNYDDLLDETVLLFQKMYPDEAFFPETPSLPENPEEDIEGLSLED